VVSTLLNSTVDKGRRLLRDPKLSSLCKIIKFEFAGFEAAFVNAIQLSLRRSRDHGYSSLESWRAFAIFTHALVTHITLKSQATAQVQLFNFPPREIKHALESMVSQRELLRISWASINDKYKAGDAFWHAFVTQNSHLAAGPFAGVKAESLSSRILGLLDTFIGCLSLSDVSLIPPVKQLGERHAKGVVVQAADYELFKQGILTMVRRSSDTPPTPQIQAAWSSFISIISAIMIEEGERSKKPGYVSVAERARGDTLHDFDRPLSTVLAEGLHYYSGSTSAFLNICSVQKTNVQYLVEAVSDALHSLKMISDNDFKGGFLCALAGRSIRFLHHLFANSSSLTVGNAQNILLRTRLFGFESWTSVINECLKRYCSGQLNAELAVSIHMNWVLEQEKGLCAVEEYMLPARVFSDMWERIQSRDLATPLKFMVSGKLALLSNMAAWRTSPHFFNKLRIMNLLQTLSIMSKSQFVGSEYQIAAGTLGVWLQILGMADFAEEVVRIIFTSVCDVIKEENTNRRSMVIYGLGDAVKELVLCGTQVSGFTDGDRKCASDSWGSILDFANQVSERSSIFDCMFQLIPALKTSIFRRVSIPVLFESLKRMIGEVVDINKPPMSEVALRRLGVQHAIAGVLEEYYPVFLTGFIAFVQDIEIKMGTSHSVPVASWLRILFTIANEMSKATVSVRKINASVQQEDLSSIVKIQALYRGKMARASRRRARLLKSNALRDTLNLDSDDEESQSARSTTYDSDSEWESPQFKIRFKTRRILKMLWDSMGAEQLHIVSAVVINYGDAYPMKLTDVGGPNKPVKVLVRELGDCLSRLCERCIFDSAETAVSNQISVQRSNLSIIFDLFKDPDFGRTFVETLLEPSSCNDHPAIRLAWLDLYTVLRNQMHHILAPPQVWEE
jgi:hemoglobin-like flavoprotein